MRLSIKKATADSISRLLQKYLDTTNILQYPEEEFARFDFFGLRTLYKVLSCRIRNQFGNQKSMRKSEIKVQKS